MAKCAMMLLGMALPRVLEAKKDWDLAISFESTDQACITDAQGTAHLSNIIASVQASLSLGDNAISMDSLSISDVKNQDCVTTTSAAPTTTAATNATTAVPTPAPTPVPTPVPTPAPTPAPTPSTNATTAAPTPSTNATTAAPTASPTPSPTPAPTPSTTAAPTPSTNATTAAPTPATTTPFTCSAGGTVGCVGAIVRLVGVDDAQTKATLEASMVLLSGMKMAITEAFGVTVSDFSIVANEAPAPTPAPTPPADADAAETARFGYSILASAALFVSTVRM